MFTSLKSRKPKKGTHFLHFSQQNRQHAPIFKYSQNLHFFEFCNAVFCICSHFLYRIEKGNISHTSQIQNILIFSWSGRIVLRLIKTFIKFDSFSRFIENNGFLTRNVITGSPEIPHLKEKTNNKSKCIFLAPQMTFLGPKKD